MRRFMVWLAVVYGLRSAALAQTSLNLSQDLAGLGIASTNMLPNRPDLDAGPLFFQGVGYAKAAVAHQLQRVFVDRGHHQNVVGHRSSEGTDPPRVRARPRSTDQRCQTGVPRRTLVAENV